jgi:hypothetical protein
MHPFRSEPTQLPPPNSITVHFTVEIRQENSLQSLYTDRPATPLVPVLLHSSEGIRESQPRNTSSRFGMLALAANPFAEAALRTIAHNEMRGFHTMFAIPGRSPDDGVPATETAARIVCADVRSLLVLGQQLMSGEKLEDHAKAIPADVIEINVVADHWLGYLESLKSLDAPLFYMLHDSLHTHTPLHILYRWDALRRHMSQAGQTFAAVVRQAEQLTRRKWPPLVLELYFLLIECVPKTMGACNRLTLFSHTEGLAEFLSRGSVDSEDLECYLSAYCAALRIRFYLWRMTRPNTMCRLRKYNRQVKAECFRLYYKQLLYLVTQEFRRAQDPASEQFHNVRRKLVGKPIEIESIAKPLIGKSSHFCTICQDNTHGIGLRVSTVLRVCIWSRVSTAHVESRHTLKLYLPELSNVPPRAFEMAASGDELRARRSYRTTVGLAV